MVFIIVFIMVFIMVFIKVFIMVFVMVYIVIMVYKVIMVFIMLYKVIMVIKGFFLMKQFLFINHIRNEYQIFLNLMEFKFLIMVHPMEIHFNQIDC